jgi:hypothetical protein
MKLNFLGDVYLNNVYKINFKLDNYIFNLEYPLSTSGIPAKNKVNLGINEEQYILKTFGKNPFAVNLANNHIMDYGEEAFNETISFLEKEDIKYFGAGNQSNNYNNPLIFEFNKKRIALYGYCCLSTTPVIGDLKNNGSAPLDMNLIEQDIRKSKNLDIDFRIVNLHWGDEEVKYPKPSDIKKSHQIIDYGVDIIIGHHAHVIQSIGTYKNKDIYYGIGNFLFPDLDVPCNFDGNNFKNKYVKKQSENNKYSIILEMNEDLSINKFITKFDKNNVSFSKKDFFSYKLIKSENIYKLYSKYNKKKGTVIRFLKNPKLPSIKQLKIFLGLK